MWELLCLILLYLFYFKMLNFESFIIFLKPPPCILQGLLAVWQQKLTSWKKFDLDGQLTLDARTSNMKFTSFASSQPAALDTWM